MKKVVKFGGSSLASAEQFMKVGAIIRADESRRYVVPSAPGKRFSDDTKVTDMLYHCYELAEQSKAFNKQLNQIKDRYNEIIYGLKLDLSLDEDFEIIKKQFVAKEGTNMDGATFMLYMVLPLSSIGIMFSIAFCNIDFGNVTLAKYCLAIFCILLMAGNGTAFYAYNRYAKLCMEREINKRTVLMQEMELENYKKINQANDKYMELLHNSNHYMRTVYGLLEQDNKDEAINIMDSVLTEYEEGELIEYSTNSILNTILSEYYDKSKTNHIEFNIFVEPGFNIECVESMDLVAMVSNLISNAYEAALKSDEKKIKVQMYMQNDGSFIIIKIENSFSGEIVRQGDRLLTTKKDGNIHGVGIESVEKVAEKYDGWVSTSWGNKSFRTMLVLNNSYVV